MIYINIAGNYLLNTSSIICYSYVFFIFLNLPYFNFIILLNIFLILVPNDFTAVVYNISIDGKVGDPIATTGCT